MLINNQIPYLPVNGVHIGNAVGKKISRVSRQLFCNCEINSIQFQHNFIQVDKLNENGISSADFLNTYGAKINFEEKTIRMVIDGQNHFLPFFEKMPVKKTDILQIHQLIHNKTMELDLGNLNTNPNHDYIKLTEQENNIFQQILSDYDEIFREEPGRIRNIECQIRITKGEPLYQRAYPIPMSKLSKMEQKIQRMLELKIIEPSLSPWSSPIIPVEKKNGEIRICLDARKINIRIIPNRECPMAVEEILNKFQGARYLSSIDLRSGYW